MIPVSNSYYYKKSKVFTFNWVNENTVFNILHNSSPSSPYLRPASFWVTYLISLRITEGGILNSWAECSAIYKE